MVSRIYGEIVTMNAKERVDQLNAEIMATREWMVKIIYEQWFKHIMEMLKK